VLEGTNNIIPFSLEVIKNVVGTVTTLKVGPDGINMGFVMDFRDILKEDLCCFFNEFHRNGKISKGLNNTFIALIPKIDSRQRLSNFRPIALVECIYKIMSKVMANMLCGVFVSKSQQLLSKEGKFYMGFLSPMSWFTMLIVSIKN